MGVNLGVVGFVCFDGFFGSIVCMRLFPTLSAVATQQALYIFILLYSPILSYSVKLKI